MLLGALLVLLWVMFAGKSNEAIVEVDHEEFRKNMKMLIHVKDNEINRLKKINEECVKSFSVKEVIVEENWLERTKIEFFVICIEQTRNRYHHLREVLQGGPFRVNEVQGCTPNDPEVWEGTLKQKFTFFD